MSSHPLEVGDNTTNYTHDGCWCGTEVVVQRFRNSPHLVVLQQVLINELTQLSAVTKLKSAGNATWTFDKFATTVRTAMTHRRATRCTKRALETADDSWSVVRQ